MPHFVRRQRKHKVLARQHSSPGQSFSTNQEQILPVSKSDREERKRKLKAELLAQQPPSKSLKKKAKRLDKYIETKLRKEENLELLRKLGQQNTKVNGLQSSKSLGLVLGKRTREDFVDARQLSMNDGGTRDEEEQEGDSEDSFEENHRSAFNPQAAEESIVVENMTKMTEQGTGLKQPLQIGQDGMPVIQSKRKKKKKAKFGIPDDIPWEGFGSDSEEVSAEQDSNLSDRMYADSSDHSDSFEGSYFDTDAGEDEAPDSDISDSGATQKTSAFKAWATQQINESLGHIPSEAVQKQSAQQVIQISEKLSPLKTSITETSEDEFPRRPSRRVYSVRVARSPEITQARTGLPIVAEEQKIMESIHNNSAVIVWGATGSGKTTQVPQFLFEAGYGSPESSTPGMIGITQPRRVAAISMAKRVAQELGEHGKRVSHQIRFESTTTKDTAIKYMTDGILLREISQDFSLSKYSVLIIDEAHERSVNTDILIGMLSRIVGLRETLSKQDSKISPLKLVIMSATLRISDFLQNPALFKSGPPPLVQAEGRQHPVTIHFARQTQGDYVEEMFRKVSKGHHKLPPGGMLVFLTGQNEIKTLLHRLGTTLRKTSTSGTRSARVHTTASQTPLEIDDFELGELSNSPEDDGPDDINSLTGYESDEDFNIGEDAGNSTSMVHLLPLYSQLPTREQLRIFDVPPQGSRLVVLATNVAETSLTIPGIRYVFDCGRSKERTYNELTEVQSFEVDWISKASAEQRAGRAGRTGPGHCYRLYSSAVYERDFVEYSKPEILRTPMEGVVLQLKELGLEKVVNFPFPSPPSSNSLIKAEKLLKNLGSLSTEGQVTQLGKDLSLYPLSPRYGKMLTLGLRQGCLSLVIALVAGLTVGEVFIQKNQIDDTNDGDIDESELEQIRKQRRWEYNKAQSEFMIDDGTSDALKTLTAICASAYESHHLQEFCESHFLRIKALKEISLLRQQLTSIVQANHREAMVGAYQAELPRASAREMKVIKEIVTAGFIDQVAIRADMLPNAPAIHRKAKRAIDVPFVPLVPLGNNAAALEDQAIYIHPSSVLAHKPASRLPQYLVYSHLQQSQTSFAGSEKAAKIRMLPLTGIGGRQLAALAHGTPLLTYGKPVEAKSLGGHPEKQEAWVVPYLVGEAGSMGWPMPPRKVVQRKDPKTGWVVEKFLA